MLPGSLNHPYAAQSHDLALYRIALKSFAAYLS